MKIENIPPLPSLPYCRDETFQTNQIVDTGMALIGVIDSLEVPLSVTVTLEDASPTERNGKEHRIGSPGANCHSGITFGGTFQEKVEKPSK